MRFQLAELSSPSAEIAEELDSLIIDVNRVLCDEVGRWVLSAHHHDAQSELSLSWQRHKSNLWLIVRSSMPKRESAGLLITKQVVLPMSHH